MESKKSKRLRRAARSRYIIGKKNTARLTVYRSNNHMYAQIISPCATKVMAQASTLDASIKGVGKHNLDIALAEKVGKVVAERALKVGIDTVVFDRAGFRYHGRVKALAESARAGGLKF